MTDLEDFDYTVTPGEGVGPLKLGMTQQQIRDILGEPERAREPSRVNTSRFDSYHKRGLKIFYQGESDFICTTIEIMDQDKPAIVSGKNIMMEDKEDVVPALKHLDSSATVDDLGIECNRIGMFVFTDDDPRIKDEEWYDIDSDSNPQVVLSVSVHEAGKTTAETC